MAARSLTRTPHTTIYNTATTGGGTAASGAATTTTTEPRPSSWCYVKLGWVDEVTQPILPDLDRAFACIGACVGIVLCWGV